MFEVASKSAFGVGWMGLDDSSFLPERVLWRVLARARFQAIKCSFLSFLSAALSHLQLDPRTDVRTPGNLLFLDKFSSISTFSCDRWVGMVLAGVWFVCFWSFVG